MKRKLISFGALLSFWYLMSMTVLARDTGSAVSDIMNDSRFSGAMSSISWLTGVIDHYSTMVITLVAFSIIAMALFRNVCAAAYCSNNKFWNKVAEAHEAAEGASLASVAQGFKNLPNKTWGGAGGIKGTLLCFIPNIKALTDFDDVDMEPKHYWMKAIPQMLACIVIGVFVYDGLYRDTASVVGAMGSEVIGRCLASVDPSSLVDKITLTTGTPDNIFEKDQSSIGKINYEISKAIYTKYRSTWGLSSTEDKTRLMRNAEAIATSFSQEFSTYVTVTDETNKIKTLSGLSVTVVGDSVPDGSVPLSGNWYAHSGAKDASDAFDTTDGGETTSFALFYIMQGSNDAQNASRCLHITGTLVKKDGDSSKQQTNNVGVQAVSSRITHTIDEVQTGANFGTEGTDWKKGAWITQTAIKSFEGNYHDLVKQFIMDTYNPEGTAEEDKYVVTIKSIQVNFENGWDTANHQHIHLVKGYEARVPVVYDVVFNYSKGTVAHAGTAQITIYVEQ